MASVSVVVPALDEERTVAAAIASVRAQADEVIVVDGGSRDATRERARAARARVIEAPRGRGRQLARGAAAASGDWLVFLHADTRLEAGWAEALRALPPEVSWGAFRFALDAPGWPYRAVEAGVRARCSLFHLPYGDQALFARREAYVRAGGFPELPLMEDVSFVARVKRTGRGRMLTLRATTSARRWEEHGILRTTALNWTALALYAAGWPPERIARFYESGTARA
jgi:rSAM/selenodomain-associated transferase 2